MRQGASFLALQQADRASGLKGTGDFGQTGEYDLPARPSLTGGKLAPPGVTSWATAEIAAKA